MTTVQPLRRTDDIRRIKQILIKQSFRDYIIFSMGINLGLRVSDILALDVKDVKNKDFVDIVEKKTNKYKRFPLNRRLKEILWLFTKGRDVNEPLFMTYRKNRLDRTTVYNSLRDACRKAGIKEKIGTHTMRKTFGYYHYRKYNDIAILQKIFNHSSTSVTLRYIGIEQEDINFSYNNFIL